MIKREMASTIKGLAAGYPALAITGPRQSGKTTLARALFPKKPYVLLKDPDTRLLARTDPRGFLSRYAEGAVFDDIQECPALFEYLQGCIDAAPAPGRFILTGSQQFGLMASITESLAGRVAMVELLPFTLSESRRITGRQRLEPTLFTGLYPPVHDRKLDPARWFANYVTTYIERDVRKMINVRDLATFQRFVRLCAGRTGQLLNLSELGTDAGISYNTAKAWISLLEASYILFLLQPHHRNFNKRIIKSPKLYFYDTGLAAHLIGIQNPQQLETHPQRGALFETLIVSELSKARRNRGLTPNLYFWRDRAGHEIDLLLEEADELVPVEIKSGQTVNRDFFKGLQYWENLSGDSTPRSFLIYGGQTGSRKGGTEILGWQDLGRLEKQL